MAATKGEDHRIDLVCEGGGVKGIGLAGAFSVLEEQGWQPQIAAGFTAAELFRERETGVV